MTLSPIFRSREAVEILRSHGVWEGLQEAAGGQAAAVRRVKGDLDSVLHPRFIERENRERSDPGKEPSLGFMQEYFFLILFRSVLASIGVRMSALDFYAEVNFCIQGTIMAADDLFDDQGRSLLPLETGAGPRFGAILQLLCFQRLLARALERGIEAGLLTRVDSTDLQRELLSDMAAIGSLEGAEEGGVAEVLRPDRMVDEVHRLRGGALFRLGFVAPRQLERGVTRERVFRAEVAISRLGTAFQIVDDLTDFETDLRRRSHNILLAQIHHAGDHREQDALHRIRAGDPLSEGEVERRFLNSARAVLDLGETEARAGLEGLSRLGFWLDPELAEPLVRSIVGLEGVSRMRAITVEP